MISNHDLRELIEYKSGWSNSTLSIYLNVDQSQVANSNRMFEVKLINRLRALAEDLSGLEREQFDKAVDQVLLFMAEYSPRAKSLVVFCDAAKNLFWTREINIPISTTVLWGGSIYLRPLLELLSDNKRYGVVLADRARARLFTIFLGSVEERHKLNAQADVTQTKTSGRDQIRSQMRYQRRANTRARGHLKQVAELIDQVNSRKEFNRLVLAGSPEAMGETYRQLPKRLRARVIGKLTMPLAADEQQILEETFKLIEAIERKSEIELLEQLITAAEKQERATLGLAATLLAAQTCQIWQLIIAEGSVTAGCRCLNCDSLDSLSSKRLDFCQYCGAMVETVPDLFDLMAKRVIALGGSVERLRGDAAKRLQEYDGIGALLK